MTKYQVVGTLAVSCWTEVEADTPEQAMQIAKSRAVAEHSIDGSYAEDECWHFDNDGTPDNLRAEESED